MRYAVEIDGVAYEAASVIVSRGRYYAGPYVVAPVAALSEPLLHVCLFERWGRRHRCGSGWRCCSAGCHASAAIAWSPAAMQPLGAERCR